MQHHIGNEDLHLVEREEAPRAGMLAEPESEEGFVYGGAAPRFRLLSVPARRRIKSVDDVAGRTGLREAEWLEAHGVRVYRVVVVNSFYWDSHDRAVGNLKR